MPMFSNGSYWNRKSLSSKNYIPIFPIGICWYTKILRGKSYSSCWYTKTLRSKSYVPIFSVRSCWYTKSARIRVTIPYFPQSVVVIQSY